MGRDIKWSKILNLVFRREPYLKTVLPYSLIVLSQLSIIGSFKWDKFIVKVIT